MKTASQINSAFCYQLGLAYNSDDFSVIIDYIEEALSILRFYGLDGKTPHSPYRVTRWQNSAGYTTPGGSSGVSWTVGSPDPAKLYRLRDEAFMCRQNILFLQQQGQLPEALKKLHDPLLEEMKVDYSNFIERMTGLNNTDYRICGTLIVVAMFGLCVWLFQRMSPQPSMGTRELLSNYWFFTLVVLVVALIVIYTVYNPDYRFVRWKSKRMQNWNGWQQQAKFP